jgi:putative hydrolase
MDPVRLDQDFHVHSTFSDDAVSSPADNVAAAVEAGLSTLCLVDHVRVDTPWVPELVSTVRDLALRAPLELLVGVEAKILDTSGRLDLPDSAHSVDHVLIADHQFPWGSGPLQPAAVRGMLDRGELSPSGVVEQLVVAMTEALGQVARPVLAHPFSLLPKMGLDEALVTDAMLDHLAQRARLTGALVEVNEKWSCPGPRLARALWVRGVQMVAGSDSHHCASVGAYPGVTANLGNWSTPFRPEELAAAS